MCSSSDEGSQNIEGKGQSDSTGTCPSCQGELSEDAVICTTCGLDLRTGKMLSTEVQTSEPSPDKCPDCGSFVGWDGVQCSRCGHSHSGRAEDRRAILEQLNDFERKLPFVGRSSNYISRPGERVVKINDARRAAKIVGAPPIRRFRDIAKTYFQNRTLFIVIVTACVASAMFGHSVRIWGLEAARYTLPAVMSGITLVAGSGWVMLSRALFFVEIGVVGHHYGEVGLPWSSGGSKKRRFTKISLSGSDRVEYVRGAVRWYHRGYHFIFLGIILAGCLIVGLLVPPMPALLGLPCVIALVGLPMFGYRHLMRNAAEEMEPSIQNGGDKRSDESPSATTE